MADMGWTNYISGVEAAEAEKVNEITGGEWDYEEMDPGYPGDRNEPSDPGSRATVYSIVYDPDSGREHSVELAHMESPAYKPISASGNTDFDPEPIGYEDANARLMAASQAMYRALLIVEDQRKSQSAAFPDFVWDYVREALDKSGRPRIAEPVSEAQDPPAEHFCPHCDSPRGLNPSGPCRGCGETW